MKKFSIVLLLMALLAALILPFATQRETGGEQAQYLRVHIRANSNSEEDQRVKYLVRDRVVEFLTPTVAECTTKEAAMQKLSGCLLEIERVAVAALRKEGYLYGARASLRRESFPTRVYENTTLPAGEYDALILELGSGKGDNWWCVVYPPLCFTGGGGSITYQSKILEIIRSFHKK